MSMQKKVHVQKIKKQKKKKQKKKKKTMKVPLGNNTLKTENPSLWLHISQQCTVFPLITALHA